MFKKIFKGLNQILNPKEVWDNVRNTLKFLDRANRTVYHFLRAGIVGGSIGATYNFLFKKMSFKGAYERAKFNQAKAYREAFLATGRFSEKGAAKWGGYATLATLIIAGIVVSIVTSGSATPWYVGMIGAMSSLLMGLAFNYAVNGLNQFYQWLYGYDFTNNTNLGGILVLQDSIFDWLAGGQCYTACYAGGDLYVSDRMVSPLSVAFNMPGNKDVTPALKTHMPYENNAGGEYYNNFKG